MNLAAMLLLAASLPDGSRLVDALALAVVASRAEVQR